MGFLDKAKKLAEQAQTKLDEAQKQFNQGQSGTGSPPPGQAVEYDQHGRPVPREEPAPAAPGQAPPHGDPLADQATAPAASPSVPGAAAPVPDPAAPAPRSAPEEPAAPAGAPDAPAAPPGPPEGGTEEDRNNPSYAPPKLSSGDPLAP
jgi:hypothetical protein